MERQERKQDKNKDKDILLLLFNTITLGKFGPIGRISQIISWGEGCLFLYFSSWETKQNDYTYNSKEMEGMNQFPFAIVLIEIYDLRNHHVEFRGDAFRSLTKIIILMGKNKVNSERDGRKS